MRILILIITCFAISFTTQASNTNKLSNALKKCVTIKDNIHRLTCYDNLATSSAIIASKRASRDFSEKTLTVTKNAKVVMQNKAKQHKKKSIEITTQTAKAKKVTKITKADGVDDFGKEHLRKNPEEEVRKVNLIIAKLTKNAFKQWRIVFQNGQVWQQKDESRIRLKTGDQVELAKGMFNAVYLKKTNTNKRIKVKRIK